MKKVKIYQYSKCGTCRNAVKALKRNGFEVDSVELFDHPPDRVTLTELIRKSDLDINKFFNTSGEVYKEMNLKDKMKAMSDEQKIGLLSSNGRLIKRPIVTDGKQVTVGFKEQQFNQVWS